MEDLQRVQTDYTEQLYQRHVSRQTAVTVPILQTFFFFTLPVVFLVAVGVIAANLWLSIRIPWQVGLMLPMIAGAVVQFMAGRDRLSNWDHFFNSIEGLLKVDLNGDQQVGNPTRTIKADYRENAKHWEEFELRGGSERDLLSWLAALYNGKSVSEETWSGRVRGRPFSQDEVAFNREALVKKGFAEWKDPNNERLGIRVTERGRAWIKMSLEQNGYPLPHPEGK